MDLSGWIGLVALIVAVAINPALVLLQGRDAERREEKRRQVEREERIESEAWAIRDGKRAALLEFATLIRRDCQILRGGQLTPKQVEQTSRAYSEVVRIVSREDERKALLSVWHNYESLQDLDDGYVKFVLSDLVRLEQVTAWRFV